MKISPQLKILLEPLVSMQKLMQEARCAWATIGGVAVSLLAKPRFTADVDIVALIKDEDIPRIIKIAKRYGLSQRIKNAAAFAKKNRVLLLKHSASGINIDISLGLLPFEKEAIERSKRYKIGRLVLYLPTPEDLIIFKAVANRPQDILDIREIVKNNPKIDRKYIREKVKEFVRALEMPQIWLDIEAIITKAK